MRKFNQTVFLLCGIALMLAAFPVFAQKSDERQEVRINKQPLQDLGAYVKEKLDRGEVDLTQPFKVAAEVSLNKDGRFDKSTFVLAEGDEQLVSIAKTAIEAAGNSGVFGYLRNLGAEELKITFAQDKDKVFGLIESEQITKERAMTLASQLNTLVSAAKYVSKREDEKTLLGGFRISSSEKVVMINFSLPAQTVRDMLERNLKKAAQAETWKGE